MTQFLPVQGNGAGVRERAFRSVGIQDEDFVVIGAGDHVELSGLRILKHIRRPQADATALYLFGDILQVQGFSCIGPVQQVIGPEHVVIVGAPFPPAIRSIAVVVVPRAEDIHATVKNMGFTIGNEQFPAGRQDGILGQITHGDQATVFLPGLGIGGKDPGIAGRYSEDRSPLVHLRHCLIAGSPLQLPRGRSLKIQLKALALIQHSGRPIQFPGPGRLLLAGKRQRKEYPRSYLHNSQFIIFLCHATPRRHSSRRPDSHSRKHCPAGGNWFRSIRSRS